MIQLALPLKRFLAGLALLALLPAVAAAQNPLLSTPRDTSAICDLMRRFVQATLNKPIPVGLADSVGIDDFAATLTAQTGKGFWPVGTEQCILRDVRTIRRGDSVVVVRYITIGDSVPYSGPLTIDWSFFLRRTDSANWRIYAVRHLTGIDKVVGSLVALSQAQDYPPSLKPLVAHELEPALWSNQRVRQHFNQYRPQLQALVAQFSRKNDSLLALGRVDRRINQLNRAGIDWGIAAQEVPKEYIDEYLKNANDEQRVTLQAQLRQVARLRNEGTAALNKFIRKYKLNARRLDTVVSIMRECSVSFATNRLPWKGSVQLTVAGSFDDAVGFLYSPGGQIPLLSSQEYFDLEELGDGWWIFRST